jgi:hypothetical protein
MAPKFHRFEEFAKKEGLKKGPAPPEPEDPTESRPSASGDAGDSFAGAGHQEEKPLRPMPSWMDLDEMEIDRNKYLIGEGFLEPGGYVVLVGASYAGKAPCAPSYQCPSLPGEVCSVFRLLGRFEASLCKQRISRTN